MKKSAMNVAAIALAAASLGAVGCISVKTESEIKPIHITMDVNLKVDKNLDSAFSDERRPSESPRSGDYKQVKELLDRKVAGFNRLAMLESRSGATESDRIAIAEMNMRRQRRFDEVAKASGASGEAVQKRQAAKLRSAIPSGSGVWIQSEDGAWLQR